MTNLFLTRLYACMNTPLYSELGRGGGSDGVFTKLRSRLISLLEASALMGA